MGIETHKPRKKRRYSEEMKKEVVKLSQRVGLSKASETTGVCRSSIALWKKRYPRCQRQCRQPRIPEAFEGKQNPSRGD